ncbi:MAG: hypothetical protein AW10_03988 [Candidatus Accumulibacter appositus]|jgi:hypothetical protein|uniref:Uncharacterized protein n=2 Tax=Betaproteobacteria TaxID=28216 RepID=A0A011PJB7_9PROT|nr:MAG: hypothetical protein AW10_03988 [Candidatus Accumulibacter appositus]
MPDVNLPHGLRHVLVHVTLGSAFPPAANSASDVALLRAANRAMQRKTQGVEDAFLFVVVGQHTREAVSATFSAYGFPKATVVCIETADVEHRLEMGEEIVPGEIGNAVAMWLNREHIGAVAAFPKDYADTEFWWSGVEHDDNVFDWSFDDGDFAKALPTSHKRKAATWLTILGHAVDLLAMHATEPDALVHDIAAAWAATLCEWLHGFEAANGNSYNHFDYEANSILYPSAFFLGFELARLSGNDLEAICGEAESDVDDLSRVALKAITQEKRAELREALSDFFGGDSALYWALHSAIWPSYSDAYPRPMQEALERELGSSDFDSLARLDAPWRYVTEGWCDDADD